ncbi:MAG: ankyrin repeat domain-containing protein [Mariniblastus sp.]|nr:ankyrin repeat domain-containing protein [Mariniblastus sp.]
MKLASFVICICLILTGILIGTGARDGREPTEHNDQAPSIEAQRLEREPRPTGHRSFLSPHASPIASDGQHVYVVNTPAGTLDILDVATKAIVHRTRVGIEPVSLAIRPDGQEIWVANHISDSVSIIDNDRASQTYRQVIATIQEFGRRSRSTEFDEPVGIAFANNRKAYVALSSENEIAVVDVASREVGKRLKIRSQDPRAIKVRGDRLYVIPFESNNKTQLSGGNRRDIDGDLVTFDAWNHSIEHNNVLSLGHVVDIVKHPDVPDRDLFVYDTKTDKLVATVDTLGTLLYGLAIDSRGQVYVAQTDARNDINGRSGTKDHSLKELENRAFLNQITKVGFDGDTAAKPEFIDLEPLPPAQPEPGQALATPFAIEISDDDRTLVVSAAGSDKLFTVDVETGQILGRVDVDSVPRGIALESGDDGRARRAWVHNAVENSISLIDLADAANPQVIDSIRLEDPTPAVIKRGRKVFNMASASTTGTFSCASCHPDGHTDQLLWVLKTPVVSGGDQIMPRSTMPLRGLRDTAPFHWDGIPGDPYGGNNSASIRRPVKPNSDPDIPETTTRHVIDGSLESTMTLVGLTVTNDEGKAGLLSAAQRDDLAKFLLDIPFPPAPQRAYTNVVSREAREGFELFHIQGDDDPSRTTFNVCGDCHRMPFLVSTNTPGTGMDAPTWRGAYDRWLILPQGRLNIVEFDFFRRIAEGGLDERRIWQLSWAGRRRFNPVWNMVLEGSTGVSGAYGRQLTMNRETAQGGRTRDLLAALEQSSRDGAIVLEVDGVMMKQPQATPLVLQFDPQLEGGKYVRVTTDTPVRKVTGLVATDPSNVVFRSFDLDQAYTRQDLAKLASDGAFIGTFTARQVENGNQQHPQPAIWTRGTMHAQRGHQQFPFLYQGKQQMTISGHHIDEGARVIVDGEVVEADLETGEDKTVKISLAKLPTEGMHLLQIQNGNGLFSNDFIFHVAGDRAAASEARRKIRRDRIPQRLALWEAIKENKLAEVKQLVEGGTSINSRHPESGNTPLGLAATHSRRDIAQFLIEQGARVSGSNRDGNTPLHIAAFFCDFEFVQLLLDNGADRQKENDKQENAVDVVTGWSDRTGAFYRAVGSSLGREFDLDQLPQDRQRMAKLIQDYQGE